MSTRASAPRPLLPASLDVAYDVADSPLGPLFLATTERGFCRISYDAEPEAEEELLARGFGARVLRSPRALDEAQRELDDYFEGRRHTFELPVDLAPVGEFQREVLQPRARVPFGYRSRPTARSPPTRPPPRRASGRRRDEPNPSHRAAVPPGGRLGRQARRLRGGIERKIALLRLEGIEFVEGALVAAAATGAT